jgi:hypothetical protein
MGNQRWEEGEKNEQNWIPSSPLAKRSRTSSSPCLAVNTVVEVRSCQRDDLPSKGESEDTSHDARAAYHHQS